MLTEEWRPVVLPPFMSHTYEVSSYGEVRYKPTGGLLTNIYHSTNGYDYVTLMIDPSYANEIPGTNKLKMMKVILDWLIAMVFSIIPPTAYQNATIRHRDGDKSNHHADNIEWVDNDVDWKCVNYSNIVDKYAVSNTGVIKETLSGKVIERSVDVDDDVIVPLLTTTGDYKIFKVHNIVAHTYYGRREPNEIVNHINGVKNNCSIYNLEYIDYGENIRNGINEGLLPTNTKVKPKLDVETVDMVREKLFKHDGCVRLVMKEIDHDEYPMLTGRKIKAIRDGDGYPDSNKYSKEELERLSKMRTNKPRVDITPDIENIVVGLLVKHNGDVKAVCADPGCKVSQSKVYQIKNSLNDKNIFN